MDGRRYVPLILLLFSGCDLLMDALIDTDRRIVYLIDGQVDTLVVDASVGWSVESPAERSPHATLVARVIKAVEPDVQIVNVVVYKRFSSGGTGTHASWCTSAIEWIASQRPGVVLIQAPIPWYDQQYHNALQNLGMPIVVPAGNAGIDICRTNSTPQANVEEAIVVGADAEWSNYGPCVDVIEEDRWFGKRGTSLSAAAYAAARTNSG